MTAPDGKNYASCRDGACQVLVNVGSRIRVNTSKGPATVQVSAVGAEGISITLLADSGFSGTVSSGPNQGDFMKYNEIQFTAVAVEGSSGVLRLTKN